MTATETFRAMLDERGVEWWPMRDVENGYHQDRDTEFVIDGKKYTAHEWGGTLNVYGLTPEQAIAATLGLGTCHAIDTGYATAFCSVCGAEFMGSIMTNEPPDYVKPLTRCPECGRKIVEVDT